MCEVVGPRKAKRRGRDTAKQPMDANEGQHTATTLQNASNFRGQIQIRSSFQHPFESSTEFRKGNQIFDPVTKSKDRRPNGVFLGFLRESRFRQVGRIQIVLAGYPHQREKGIAAGIGEGADSNGHRNIDCLHSW